MKPCHMGTHQSKVLSKSYPMITNMTGFIMVFKKTLCPCTLYKSVGRVNPERQICIVQFDSEFGTLFIVTFFCHIAAKL